MMLPGCVDSDCLTGEDVDISSSDRQHSSGGLSKSDSASNEPAVRRRRCRLIPVDRTGMC